MILSKEKANLFYDTRTKLRVTCRGQDLFLHFGLSSELQPTQNIKPSIQMDTLETVTLQGKNWEFWPLYNRDVVQTSAPDSPKWSQYATKREPAELKSSVDTVPSQWVKCEESRARMFSVRV